MAAEVNFGAFDPVGRVAKIAEESARGTVVNCGWVRPEQRTEESTRAHEAAVAAMPRFSIRGKTNLESRRYALWQGARQVLGKDPAWIWQQTGSCVGAGGGNMAMVTQGVEIALKGESEQFRWLWWLYAYGRSRFHSGIRGPGEGSQGSGWAKAATTDGQFELDPEGEPDLPDPSIRSGWAVHPSSLEMKWSDGGKIDANWIKVGKTHLFKTAARLRSADDCVEALANGYAITQASMFGFSPMVPPVEGKGPNQVRLVRRWNATWSHQTWVDEFWDHPDLGPIFHWGNNWGPDAHNPGGVTPSGYPNTGVYITYELMHEIARRSDSEVYAFSAFDGFPARELNFSAF